MGSTARILSLLFIMSGFLLSHAQASTATTILLFGDSIVAGYGLSGQDSLSVQLEKNLRDKGRNVSVINGGVSGDTTSSGRSRLEWSLKKYQPDLVVLALGGNDVLRGFQPEITRDNLDAMLAMLQKKKIPAILSAVQAPENLGDVYIKNFNKIYGNLAKKYNTPLYPFLLETTFGKPNLMQADGIHPNAEGVKVIADALSIYLFKELANIPNGRTLSNN